MILQGIWLRSGTEYYCLWRIISPDDMWKRWHKSRIRLFWQDQDRIGIVWPGDSWGGVRTSFAQIEHCWWTELRLKNFVSKKEMMTRKCSGQVSGDRTGDWTKNSWRTCWHRETNGHDRSWKETIAASATIWITVVRSCDNQIRLRRRSCCMHELKSSRMRSTRGKSPSGRLSRWHCKNYQSNELCR